MGTAEQILVVILAGALAILLLLAIIAMVFAIKLLQSLRRISASAESLVHSAETVGDILKNTAGPLGAIKLIRSIVEIITQNKSGKGK